MADGDGGGRKLPELVTNVICQALINAAGPIAACLADYEVLHGVAPVDVISEFLAERAVFVITVNGGGIMPCLDAETYERYANAAAN